MKIWRWPFLHDALKRFSACFFSHIKSFQFIKTSPSSRHSIRIPLNLTFSRIFPNGRSWDARSLFNCFVNGLPPHPVWNSIQKTNRTRSKKKGVILAAAVSTKDNLISDGNKVINFRRVSIDRNEETESPVKVKDGLIFFSFFFQNYEVYIRIS